MSEFCGKIGCYNPRAAGQKYCSKDHAPFANVPNTMPKPAPRVAPVGASVNPPSHGWSEDVVRERYALPERADPPAAIQSIPAEPVNSMNNSEPEPALEAEPEALPDEAESADLVSVKEAAELCGVSPFTVYTWANQGKVERMVFGPRKVRIKRASLKPYLSVTRKPEPEEFVKTYSPDPDDVDDLEAASTEEPPEELDQVDDDEGEEVQPRSEKSTDRQEFNQPEPMPMEEIRERIQEATPAPGPDEGEPDSEGDGELTEVNLEVARRLVARAVVLRSKGSRATELELLWLAVAELGLAELGDA
jgi:excisionase family DNA binding protein